MSEFDATQRLAELGPGHSAASVTWRLRGGGTMTVSVAVEGPDAVREVTRIAREAGWPGHRGRPFDYLRDDIRRAWRAAFPPI